jgi:trk system potassium uptake protein TrkA
MQQQAIVIGLGQFGMSLSRALTDRGVEVLAVDIREERVRAASTFAAESACFDATEADALGRTSPEKRDVCVCAIGDEAKEASIICTALLRQMGAKRVIARVNDDVHARILTLVGAHRVVNPEQEFGERFANQIVHQGIRGELPLGGGVLITETEVPKSFLSHSLGDLELPTRFGVTVVAIRKQSGAIVLPDAVSVVEEGDVFVVVANDGAVAQMIERS